MKKNLLIVAMLVAVMSIAGCGKTDKSDAVQATQTPQADASGAYGSGADYAGNEDYSQNVDMDVLDGETAKSETKKSDYSGEVNNNGITIEDAKLIEYEDEDVVVVSFEFTNKTDFDQSFSGVFKVVAEQDGEVLPPATVIGVDGVELLTLSQNIEPGKTISVQKSFKIGDKSTPINVIVQSHDVNDESQVTKTFEF